VLGGDFLPLPVHACGLPSYTCMRYMPMLRFALRGSRVCTQGSVMKRPPSCGQHLRMGKKSRSKLSRRMTSLHGASFALTVFGKMFPSRPVAAAFQLVENPPDGGFTFISAWIAFGNVVDAIDAQRQAPCGARCRTG